MQTLGNILLVGTGGFIGSAARYSVSLWIGGFGWKIKWPLATFAVNLIGSVLIGILLGKAMQMPESRLLPTLGIAGFCGGFTTFSTFSFETLQLLRTGNYTLGLLYVLVSVTLCVLGSWCGLMLVKS